MDLPSPKAHALQIMETCSALGHVGVQVYLVVSSLRGASNEVWERYGVTPPPEAVEILPLKEKRKSLHLLLSAQSSVAYTRSVRWARFLLDTSWLHGTPVVFETHRKSLYHKRDLETGLGRAGSKEMARLDDIFHRSWGVVCAHGTTWAKLKSRGVNCLCLWYGWTHEGYASHGPPWKVGYAGYKEVNFLAEAIRQVPGLELHVFGSPQPGEKAAGKSRVVFHPFMPHRELIKALAQTGVMVSLDEGLKIADYLSLGGAIVVPDLPSTREILGKGAVYFSFGSSESLADVLREIKEAPRFFEALKRAAARRRVLYLWPHKALELKTFLEKITQRDIRVVPPFPITSRDLP